MGQGNVLREIPILILKLLIWKYTKNLYVDFLEPLMAKEDWDNWKTPFGKTVDEKYEYDIGKIKCAKKSGYNVLEIWSSNTVSENIEICKEFIIKNENNL